MSGEAVFPAVDDDAGPAGLVDMLLGLYATLDGARTLVDELARDEGEGDAEAHAALLVDVLLGVVSLERTVRRIMPLDEPDPDAGPDRETPSLREGLWR